MRFQTMLGLVAFLCAGVALAQEHERAGELFDRADANGDGVVTRAEFEAAREQQFATRDRNGDGAIDSSDVGKRAAARPRVTQAMNAMLTRFDADKDGKLSKDEFVKGGLALFDRADTDKNAGLDAKEREAAKTALREHAQR